MCLMKKRKRSRVERMRGYIDEWRASERERDGSGEAEESNTVFFGPWREMWRYSRGRKEKIKSLARVKAKTEKENGTDWLGMRAKR